MGRATLTLRQQAVAAMKDAGMITREIADVLGITVQGVRQHLKAIERKNEDPAPARSSGPSEAQRTA